MKEQFCSQGLLIKGINLLWHPFHTSNLQEALSMRIKEKKYERNFFLYLKVVTNVKFPLRILSDNLILRSILLISKFLSTLSKFCVALGTTFNFFRKKSKRLLNCSKYIFHFPLNSDSRYAKGFKWNFGSLQIYELQNFSYLV